MIQFTKLRLSGFKSFVDKTELEIGPGLNGIVGPNGCGKSNLVEALRWVMGESSAKRMRGGGMEDVIFAGTSKRSARNLAEVSLLLDNSKRMAPTTYNNSDEIEVVRKIEKDKGSGYKINGRNARARDVQMLFADTVTGSNSPSLVSQGHVTRMINAKPHDRRLILEESAGIAGLYARRHEAELRLRAADSNLVRLEDIVGSMESRFSSLKRQARQAIKYKNLSAQIRELEVHIAYLEWLSLVEKQTDNKRNFTKAESAVAEKMVTVTQLTKTQNIQIEGLPDLRKKEAAASAILQKHKLDFQRLEEEIERYQNDLLETKTQSHQVAIDTQHEEQTLEETGSQLEKIEKEYTELLSAQDRDDILLESKTSKKKELQESLVLIEEKYSSLKENAAANMARRENLEGQVKRHKARIETVQARKDRTFKEKDQCVLDDSIYENISALEKQCADEEAKLKELKETQETVRQQLSEVEEKRELAREISSQEESNFARISAELSVLDKFFNADGGDGFDSVLEKVKAQPGFEKALSRALGDSLLAALDDAAPAYWAKARSKKSIPDFPNNTRTMLSFVEAPEELHLALSSIGFVKTQDEGASLADQLQAGQSIVSADGAYWRWDGYYIQESATDRHSLYLEQKNKQSDLEQKKETISKTLDAAREDLQKIISLFDETKGKRNTLDTEIKDTENLLNKLRPTHQKAKNDVVRIQADQKRLDEQIKSLDDDMQNLEEVLASDVKALDIVIESQNNSDNNQELISKTKDELDQAKGTYQEAVRDLDMFTQGRNTRLARIQAIADERLSLKNRNIRAGEHLKSLKARATALSEKLQELMDNPIAKQDTREAMLSKIDTFEKDRSIFADKLASCEIDVASTNKSLKDAENILGSEREKRAHAQALYTSVSEQLTELESVIDEKFEMHPKHLKQHNAITDLVDYQIGALQRLKAQKDKCTRERDSIGPVNLRAETEMNELEGELTTLLHERQDLVQAIEELRGGINKINKEARERLLAAFEHVNAHFQDLFVQLFAGGKAHLELVNSDDPLGAGLEIFAEPPGKSLQSLSLLSGGEQTLASIALIFAMFLTNPSPICVLDEIDAPLDDANVDRVCDLLEEIAERGDTRFLVVTHHRLSMARMHRLYGVTMSEKGVSQLVSVDLQASFDFVDQGKKVA